MLNELQTLLTWKQKTEVKTAMLKNKLLAALIAVPLGVLANPMVSQGQASGENITPAMTDGTEPAAIASGISDFDPFLDLPSTHFPATAGNEAAMRFFCEASHFNYDDMILYPGDPGKSHLHQYFGNTLADGNSTYNSLRTTGNGSCQGYAINRSAYWQPAMRTDDKVVVPRWGNIYYKNANPVESNAVRLPRGLQWIGGMNIHDQNYYADRLPSGYQLVGTGDGRKGWRCMTNGSGQFKYLRELDGTPTFTCPDGGQVELEMIGPQCWDGARVTTANGRDHMAYRIRRSSTGQEECPATHPWKIPSFTYKVVYTVGPEFSEWRLDSDNMPGMQQFRPGESMHFDFAEGWEDSFLEAFLRLCNGVTFGGIFGDPHDCSDGLYGDGTKGKKSGVIDFSQNSAFFATRLIDIPVDPTPDSEVYPHVHSEGGVRGNSRPGRRRHGGGE